MKALFHNLGLGDHIVCNGLVRELCKKCGEMYLFSHEKNAKNVCFMFSDLEGLSVVPIDNDIRSFNDLTERYEKLLSTLDVVNVAGGTHGCGFEKAFYTRANVGFEKKWDSFYLPRDLESEKLLFKQLGLKELDYVFVHEWGCNSIEDVPNVVNVRPHVNLGSFFDFCYIIENALEIHCMESSFKNLIEFLDLRTSKLVFYSHGREGSMSKSKLNWEVV